MKMVFCAAKQENRPFGKEYAMEYQDGMDRDTFEILDDLRSTIEEAKGAFGNRQQCQIDREDLLGLLEELEAVLPEDIRNATTIVRRREEILARAEDDAARIIEDARMQAETLASEQEIVRIAVRSMGLDDLKPFDPAEKVIEYLLEAEDKQKRLIDMTCKGFAE